MALAWGVKEAVAIDHADAVAKYMESVDEVEVEGQKAKILKAGVKERNGEATLIYRYQLV
jgi:hypothetical protein